jgi:di- and tripeptidase
MQMADDLRYASSPRSRPNGFASNADASPSAPALSHRMRHDKSILALAVSSSSLFAGTQGGEILVYSLDTYERLRVLEAHRGSVLALCLSQDQSLLFSSGTDPIINVCLRRSQSYGFAC